MTSDPDCIACPASLFCETGSTFAVGRCRHCGVSYPQHVQILDAQRLQRSPPEIIDFTNAVDIGDSVIAEAVIDCLAYGPSTNARWYPKSCPECMEEHDEVF